MPSKTNILSSQTSAGSGNLLKVDSVVVPGGILYIASVQNGQVLSDPSVTFVPIGATLPQRYLRLTDAKADTGVGLSATATGGACGIARTAGTSMQLVGETTSASATTDKAFFEFDLPDTYIPGASIQITVNAVVTGAGTLTAASTNLTVAAYTETKGVEAALIVTPAVTLPATIAADLSFTITSPGLVPGQHIAIECSLLVTSSAGANTGAINSVSYAA